MAAPGLDKIAAGNRFCLITYSTAGKRRSPSVSINNLSQSVIRPRLVRSQRFLFAYIIFCPPKNRARRDIPCQSKPLCRDVPNSVPITLCSGWASIPNSRKILALAQKPDGSALPSRQWPPRYGSWPTQRKRRVSQWTTTPLQRNAWHGGRLVIARPGNHRRTGASRTTGTHSI